MSNISFAIELRDAAADLRLVKDAGFSFVVLHADPHADTAATAARLARHGLKAIAVVLPASYVFEHTKKSLDIVETCGVPDLVMALDGAQIKQEGQIIELLGAARESISEMLAAGIRPLLGLNTMQGVNYSEVINLFAQEFDPDSLGFMPDTFEISRSATPDVPELIRSLPDRCPLLIVSDVESLEHAEPRSLGEGCLDWAAIFDAGEESAVEWYICRGSSSASGVKMAEASLAYLAERA